MIIEIEDYDGNTIGAFRIIPNAFADGGIDISKLKNFDIADADEDYIFDTDDILIRLQHNIKK